MWYERRHTIRLHYALLFGLGVPVSRPALFICDAAGYHLVHHYYHKLDLPAMLSTVSASPHTTGGWWCASEAALCTESVLLQLNNITIHPPPPLTTPTWPVSRQLHTHCPPLLRTRPAYCWYFYSLYTIPFCVLSPRWALVYDKSRWWAKPGYVETQQWLYKILPARTVLGFCRVLQSLLISYLSLRLWF